MGNRLPLGFRILPEKKFLLYGGELPQLSPDSPERIVLEIDMILLIDSEGAKS